MLVGIGVTFEAGRKEHNWEKFLLSYLPSPLPEGLCIQLSLTITLNLKKKCFFCLVILVRKEKILVDQICENLGLSYVVYWCVSEQ